MTNGDLSYLTIALPKGKLFDPAATMLKELGLTCENLQENSRKLVLVNETEKIKFIIVKTADLPTYVEYGAADIGIIGKDVLVEEAKDVYELLDLKFGFCRLMVAVPGDRQRNNLADYANQRVATKYTRTADSYFRQQGIQMEIIKLNGSIELAPIVGLSELIVDLVETGRTLKENNLVEIAQVNTATARLIANRVSFKMKLGRINAIVEGLRGIVEAKS
jgi:ATP phosphoribosyltransferase